MRGRSQAMLPGGHAMSIEAAAEDYIRPILILAVALAGFVGIVEMIVSYFRG